MDIKVLKEKIENLDPKVHSSLLKALKEEYDRLATAGCEGLEPGVTSHDPFLEMFEKAVDELNQRYPDGTAEYIQRHHPSLSSEIDKAEDKLNEVWQAGLEGKAEIEEFREALVRWYRLHIRSMEIYSKRQKEEIAE